MLLKRLYIIEITCDVIIQVTVCKKLYHTEFFPQEKITTLLFIGIAVLLAPSALLSMFFL